MTDKDYDKLKQIEVLFRVSRVTIFMKAVLHFSNLWITTVMKPLLSILALFILSSSFAQQKFNDSSANYVANWKKGESKIFYMAHNKESYEGGELRSQFNFGYEAHVTILDSTEDSYTIQWVFELPAKLKENNPRYADSLTAFNGMKMLFTTSENGEFKELINWQEVRDAYIKMMEFSLPKKMDSTAIKILAQSKAMFNSKSMVETALIREIQLFYAPYGYSFNKKGMSAAAELPNPFGGAPLPAVITSTITNLNPQQDNFTLVISQDIDKNGAQKFFEEFFKRADLPNEKAKEEAKKVVAGLEIKDYSEYQFIPSIGFPKRISFKRTVKSGDKTNTDSYIIEIKE
ncbi:MAG: hypothetical protein ABIP35_10235 [Ginsengibacter sp.]